MAGPIELKSNIDLHLDAGSVLKANPDESIYRLSAFKENRGEGMMWLHCKDIENLSITGTGTIHGNGIAFMGKELSDSYELKPLQDPSFDPRPHVLTLIGVKRLVIRDVTIREGAYWTVHLIGQPGCRDRWYLAAEQRKDTQWRRHRCGPFAQCAYQQLPYHFGR